MWGGGEGEKIQIYIWRNILRKILRGDGMRENCVHFRSFETTKTREVQKKHDEPIKITDLMKVTSEQRASLSSPRNFGTFYHYQLIILKL